MGKASRLEQILTIAEELLVAFDKYFRRPYWVVESYRPTIEEAERSWQYLLNRKIIGPNSRFRPRKENIFSLITKPWDKKWRLVVFDIPEKNRLARDALRKKLKELGFAPLQRSTWISPLAIDPFLEKLDDQISNNSWFFIFQGEINKKDPKELVRELWPIENWKEEAEGLVEKIRGTKEVSAKIKQEFWELVSLHPRVPLDLLPKNWPLTKLAKIFARKNRKSLFVN